MTGDYEMANELAAELGLRNPITVTNRYLREITEESIAALQVENQPYPSIFRRGNALVSLVTGDAKTFAEPVSPPRLKGLLDRAADFVKVDRHGNETPA